jgi:uncharacterized protein YndB with AHSA1/START domain
MVADRIEREITIAAPVERVWSVLTEAEHIGGWFADAGAEIDLRPGGALVMSWEQHGTTRARVEAVEPPHRFAYRWTAHHAQGQEPAEDNSTLVEFTLAPEDGSTRLRVVETGFAALATSDEQRRGNYDDNVDGWKQMLPRIDAYVGRVAA